MEMQSSSKQNDLQGMQKFVKLPKVWQHPGVPKGWKWKSFTCQRFRILKFASKGPTCRLHNKTTKLLDSAFHIAGKKCVTQSA